jgi:hypothetical protein
MIEMTLAEYVKKVKPKVAAFHLRKSARAINKAINSERKIIVRLTDQGVFSASYEIKDYGAEPEVPS